MVKRIGYSFIYFIFYAVICASIGRITGSADYLNVAIIGAIGAFFGLFVGYGIGKNERD